MAATERNNLTFALPDLSALSDAEQLQVMAVMQRAKDFETEEGRKHRQPMDGLLSKYTNVMKGWQFRWFSLEPESGYLEYFEKEEHKKQRPRGSLHLAGAAISPSDEDSQTFTVHAANGELYRLRAVDARERQHWVNRLRATAEYHTANLAQIDPAAAARYRFHDGSFSMMSDQLAVPRRKLPNDLAASSRKLMASTESIPTVVTMRSQHKGANALSGTASPFKEVKDFLCQATDYSQSLNEKIDELPQSGQYINSLDKELLLLKATSSKTLQCLEDCLGILHQRQNAINKGLSTGSSAQWLDSSYLPTLQPLTVSKLQDTPGSPASSVRHYPIDVGRAEHTQEGPINFDDEVEDEEEYRDTELGAVEEHKSIILHLLSQLKLGMDLTKVVLPTFILEKRSLLELFADCMAHPQLFLKIPDCSDPEQRMLAVLEWYLTSFHAGRQGSVAKKPYNPIIGETFQCSWKVPNQDFTENTCADGSEGCRHHQLTYKAEQVSHHPPISAFYFECAEKQIYMNASIWTKSKFMGMSIGVMMVGKIRLKLVELDEEYVFCLPSAYARSILTIPWVELGDKILITCSKTGYSASVTFHTKPFYGGKLHRLAAEVKNNHNGMIVCKVQGEWNSALEFTYEDGNTKVLDVSDLKIMRKRVRPLSLQQDFESRKLWQHVTNTLRISDVNTATEHKKFLEDRQREGERHRKETNTGFPTKYFHEEGDGWVYNNLLQKKSTKETS